MVRANKIDCIIVKDFSRFGRNSIETGYFIGNRVANAFGEGFQEAWQQRVQDAMANKFDDNRADAGSFFRDIANGKQLKLHRRNRRLAFKRFNCYSPVSDSFGNDA